MVNRLIAGNKDATYCGVNYDIVCATVAAWQPTNPGFPAWGCQCTEKYGVRSTPSVTLYCKIRNAECCLDR